MTPDAMKEAEELMMAMTFKPIEELRASNYGHIKLIASALAKRDEEIGRLRTALEDIKYHADNPFASKNGKENRKWLAYCQDVAIQALEGK